MKVIKDPEHGLLVNHFALGGKYYLSLSVLSFFAFDIPDAPLTEQAMWPFVQGELGRDAVLDAAMPKLRAEVLVWGRCYAPGGVPQPAAEVGFTAGPLEKRLFVFGDRRWRRAGGMVQVIGDPAPFTEMPIDWTHAFGGAGYAMNPLGRGLAPRPTDGGEAIWPLPNIEVPGRLIGSTADRPEPAGFAPMDITWPQRAKKLGTYDDAWLRERWPYFPDDMDWTCFNTAPEDQQMAGYFTGGEPVQMRHMHPDRPILSTAVPALRQRCFLNRRADPSRADSDWIFEEVGTHIDTLWLFPHAQRGIAVFRGTAAVADDEARDVVHLMVTTEPTAAPPRNITDYRQLLEKRLDRRVGADIAGPMAKAHEKLAEAADRLRDLPLEIADAVAANLGQAPRPVRTPHEVIAGARSVIDGGKQRLLLRERHIQELKDKFGHRVKVDPGVFAAARGRLDTAGEKISALGAEVDAMTARSAEGLTQMQGKVKQALAGVDPELVKSAGIDPETLLDAYRGKEDPWQTSGMRFVEACRDRLLERPAARQALRSLGLRPYSVHRAWIGINPSPLRVPRSRWGLPPDTRADHPDDLVIPAGLVIPCFEGARLARIAVRPLPEDPGGEPPAALLTRAMGDSSRDHVVDGSTAAAMVLGSGEKPVVRVAEALNAILLHQDIGPMAAVVVMAAPDADPGPAAKAIIEAAPRFLVVTPAGADADAAPWRPLNPGAEALPLPLGDTPTAARKDGADLWQWVADALPADLAPDPGAKPPEVDPAVPGALARLVPAIDVPALIRDIGDRVSTGVQADVDSARKAGADAKAEIRRTMTARGWDADAAFPPPAASEPETGNPYAKARDQLAAKLAALDDRLPDGLPLTPEMRQRITATGEKSLDRLSRCAAQYDAGMARLAQVEADAAAGPPDWARRLMADAGYDADNPTALKPMDRDAVVRRLADGGGLAGRNLSGADLSGLDFGGVDFRKSLLRQTRFTGGNLDGADLTGAVAEAADFSGATLRQAKMIKGVFQKAVFTGAVMTACDLSRAVMTGANLSGADLTDAQLVQTVLEKAVLTGASLKGAKARQGYFLSADASEADFTGADVSKAVFLDATIDRARFSRATARGVFFISSTGENLDFSGADLYNSRIVKGSRLTGANFTGIGAERACWMGSDLSGSTLAGADLKRALIQECDLGGCDLSGVSAKQARLTKTDLSDADLKGVNLMHGSLRKSRLVRTDLTAANLYGAEFYKTGVGETRFEGANLKMTKLYKRTDLIAEIEKDKK